MTFLVQSSDISVQIRVKKPLITTALIRVLVMEAAAVANIKRPFAVAVHIVGQARSRSLNKKWRGKDKPTNVLSFAAREGDMPQVETHVEDLGDIILCPAVAQKEAPAFHVSPKDHMKRLVVHGFLHLVGYGHEEDADAAAMEDIEWKIVKKV